MYDKLNEAEHTPPQENAKKPPKRLGMRYLKFVYILECPLIIVFCGLIALSMAWTTLIHTSLYPLASTLPMALAFAAQAIVAAVAMLQFWRYQREGVYPFNLYVITQILIWGAPLCAFVYYISVMIYNSRTQPSAWLAGLILVIPIVLIALPRYIYFRRRRYIYTFGSKTVENSSDLQEECDVKKEIPTFDQK